MKFTPSTEITVVNTVAAPRRAKTLRVFASAALAAGLTSTVALPAYAVPAEGELDPVSYAARTGKLQAIDAADYFTEQPLASLELEYIAPAATTPVTETAAGGQTAATAGRSANAVDIPAGVGGSGVMAAALAQLGVAQDCTDLVQNSLAAVGVTKRRDQGGYDLGTGIWDYTGFGQQVSLDALAPGDVLIYGNASSGTHVAIYIGNGQAVHGGYSNNTVIASHDGVGIPLTAAVRIG